MKIYSSLVAKILLVIDAMIITLNLFPTGNTGVDSLISLGDESNITVWYSSTKLAVAAFLLIILSQEFKTKRFSLLFSGFCCFCLSVSETAMLHERLSGAIYTISTGKLLTDGGNGIWVYYLAPIIVAAVFVMCRAFFHVSKNARSERYLLLAGLVLWVMVPLAETAPRWIGPLSNLAAAYEVLLEESFELLGATAVVLGLVRIGIARAGIQPAALEAN